MRVLDTAIGRVMSTFSHEIARVLRDALDHMRDGRILRDFPTQLAAVWASPVAVMRVQVVVSLVGLFLAG